MVKVKPFCVFCIPPGQLSAAFTVKLKVPVANGAPVINPDEFMLKPVGNAPKTTLNVIGDCPPDVVN